MSCQPGTSERSMETLGKKVMAGVPTDQPSRRDQSAMEKRTPLRSAGTAASGKTTRSPVGVVASGTVRKSFGNG